MHLTILLKTNDDKYHIYEEIEYDHDKFHPILFKNETRDQINSSYFLFRNDLKDEQKIIMTLGRLNL